MAENEDLKSDIEKVIYHLSFYATQYIYSK